MSVPVNDLHRSIAQIDCDLFHGGKLTEVFHFTAKSYLDS